MRTRVVRLAGAYVLLAAAAAAGTNVPSPAPDVELQRADGGTVRLSDLKGKVVLVDFWASWCGPCKLSFPALDAVYKHRHQDGLEVLAVNVDEDRRSAEEFLKDRPHDMPIFFDPRGRAPAAFRVDGMPSSYLLDRRGRIRFKHVGYTAAIGSAQAREVEVLLAETESHSTNE